MESVVVDGGEGGVVVDDAPMVLVFDFGECGTHKVEVNSLVGALVVLENGAIVLEARAPVVANQLAKTRREKLPWCVEDVDW